MAPAKPPNPAGEICGTPVVGYDLLPTFLDFAGKPVDAEKAELDGRSLRDYLRTWQNPRPRHFYWHFPYYHPEGNKFGAAAPVIGTDDFKVSQTRPHSAVRWGKYKLLYFHDDNRYELYNLESDRGETQDLAKLKPDALEKVKEELEKLLANAKARMPRGMISRK